MATWNELPVYIPNHQSQLRSTPTRANFAFVGLLPLLGGQAQTVESNFLDNEVSGSLDTTLSYGTLWRVQGQDKSNNDIDTNDGNRNFSTGPVSEVYRITSNLGTTWRNYGVLIRGMAFYDTRITDKRNDYYNHNDPSQPSQNYPHDDRFISQARGITGHRAGILNAYVYGSWNIGNMSLSACFGRQVFNWGEGIFYRGGVDTTNSVDAAKYHLPGPRLKEVLIPMEALSFNIGLTDDLPMEAFYQWNWKETRLDPVGTFFSETGLFADGDDTGYSDFTDTALDTPAPGFSDVVGLYRASGNNPLLSGALGNTGLYINGATPAYGNVVKMSSIGRDINACSGGQFGAAFHYIAEELDSTEFGFYFVSYHSKGPTLYADVGDYAGADLAALTNILRPIAGNPVEALVNGLVTADVIGNISARRELAEDICMYGFSFGTTVGDASMFGGLAYRPNLSVGTATTSDLIGGLIHSATETANGGQINIGGQVVGLSGQIHNYEWIEMFNTSLGTVYSFGPSPSFDSSTSATELASEHLCDSSLKYTAYNDSTRYYAGRGNSSYASGDDHGDQVNCNAYGYALLLNGAWNDVFAGVNVSPYMVYEDNFEGSSCQTGNFIEGHKIYILGVRAAYLNSLEGELQYTESYGGGQDSNIRDRDNIGLTVKYSFWPNR